MKIKLGNNSYSFPEKWHELKPNQYHMLCEQLFDYTNGNLSIDELRAKFFCAVIGMEFKPSDDKNDLLWENIYRLSNEFRFFLKINYKGNLSPVPIELREQLKKRTPDEINSAEPIIRWVKKLKYTYAIDAVFAKNLLPSIQLKDKKLYGYRFNLSAKFLKTTLTAQQFVYASMALDAYFKSNDENDLNMLIAILYGKDNPDLFAELNPVTKFAVLLNFQAVMAFLMNKTKYSIIWHRGSNSNNTEKKKNRYAVGAADSLYSLAKLGYGSIEELTEINLVRYLDLLLKNINDSVMMLHDHEVSVADIAERTGLSIPLITEIIES